MSTDETIGAMERFIAALLKGLRALRQLLARDKADD